MTPAELAGRIDQTLLAPEATRADVERFIDAALAYPFATLCVPPCYVGLAARKLRGSPAGVTTVAGFPLGYATAGAKLFEARTAADRGATEIDVVMNVSAFRSGEEGVVADEISAIVRALPGVAVKVIIEACYLTDAEKVRACGIIASAGAAFVKTSTGYGPGGATASDVRLLRRACGRRLGVKAAGGIRTTAEAIAMIEAGADRIGTSAGVKIIEGL
ncbi:MAG: deoxyribose-phosphate aldolase [Thermodesulfobacteriota bacterium]